MTVVFSGCCNLVGNPIPSNFIYKILGTRLDNAPSFASWIDSNCSFCEPTARALRKLSIRIRLAIDYGRRCNEYGVFGSVFDNSWARSLEGHLKSFFIKPKPVILYEILRDSHSDDRKTITVMGKEVPLWGSRTIALWITVKNDGKSPIKRMRARAKFWRLSGENERPIRRPHGLTEEEWTDYKQSMQEHMENTNQMINKTLFGRPLPFSRTPSGTFPTPWMQIDETIAHEIDLPPKSDEAGTILVSIHRPDPFMLRKAHTQPGQPVNPEQREPVIVVTQIAGIHSEIVNPVADGNFAFDLAVKFWITAENLTESVSEIFHIEIPDSFDDIVCTRMHKGSRMYEEFDNLLSV